jgi:hypothetical protein
MNKRMRELAEQAGMLRNKFGLYQDARDPDDGVDLEKFAELIVRECCQKLENDGMVEVAMELKQHFGVE